jgi:hypothetical protein
MKVVKRKGVKCKKRKKGKKRENVKKKGQIYAK